MAAPLMIIKKAIQSGNKLRIILYEAAREKDISNFFLLSFSLDGSCISVADILINEAEIEETSFSSELAKVRVDKELTITLLSNKKISYLEVHKGDMSRILEIA
jgi:hypothetical protein